MLWGGYGWDMHDSIGIVMAILFWMTLVVVLIVAVVSFVRRTRPETPPRTADSALDILKKRYVQGEIGKQEFDEKKHDIQS